MNVFKKYKIVSSIIYSLFVYIDVFIKMFTVFITTENNLRNYWWKFKKQKLINAIWKQIK